MGRPKHGVNCCNCCLLSSDLDFCTCNCHYDKVSQGVQRRKIAKGAKFRSVGYKQIKALHSFSNVGGTPLD